MVPRSVIAQGVDLILSSSYSAPTDRNRWHSVENRGVALGQVREVKREAIELGRRRILVRDQDESHKSHPSRI